MLQNNGFAAQFPRRRKVSGVVFDVDSFPIALEMRDLYVECAGHLLKDDSFRMHILMMPGRWGAHFVEAAGNDPELDAAVERMTAQKVGPTDCIVILGRDVLSTWRSEDEMTEIVAADIAAHVNALWPVADRSTGWVGPHLGQAALMGMLLKAHPVLRTYRENIEHLKEQTIRAMAMEIGYPSVELLRRENKAAIDAVGLICDRVGFTNGEYLSLPVRVADLVDAGRCMISSIIDDMECRPVGII